MYSTLKRVFIGAPIASSDEHQHRLIKLIALAVFASDAISSTAYATEEILVVLVPAGGMHALDVLIPIAIIVVILLAIVVTSYRRDDLRLPGRRRVVRRVAGEPRAPCHRWWLARRSSSTTSSPSPCRCRRRGRHHRP
jgi:hypothetical protein